MTGSRTIKVLAALVIAMTFGAFALMLMQTAPIRPNVTSLAAVAQDGEGPVKVIFETSTDLQNTWRNIVVHSTGGEAADITRRVHFVIDESGQATCTRLWRQQQAANHLAGGPHDYNADSIAICLRGDFRHKAPAQQQYDALINLVHGLQQTFIIQAQNVYLTSDLPAGSENSPGRAFPALAFSDSLLRSR